MKSFVRYTKIITIVTHMHFIKQFLKLHKSHKILTGNKQLKSHLKTFYQHHIIQVHLYSDKIILNCIIYLCIRTFICLAGETCTIVTFENTNNIRKSCYSSIFNMHHTYTPDKVIRKRIETAQNPCFCLTWISKVVKSNFRHFFVS